MKTIKLLKTAIDIYYYLMLIALVFGIITLPILLFTNQSYQVNMFDSEPIDLGMLDTLETLIIVVSMIAVLGIYFVAIRLIKQTVDIMSHGNYFSDDVIINFKKIGRLFIVCAFGFSVLKLLINLVLFSQFSININSTFMIFLIMGLFMMFLSEAFASAKQMKEENNLTI
ncbi:DUF2975 domain-containing protein [Mangrovimonas cancribranchiae]|uniref:DUF2975 domain-containing protein n=1 Tax=Mangrovimonas cancribranchiae TaxID=3080055 RepID=A0AAU6NVG8_9FLAO